MPKIYTEELKQSALDSVSDGMTRKRVCAKPGHLEIEPHMCNEDRIRRADVFFLSVSGDQRLRTAQGR